MNAILKNLRNLLLAVIAFTVLVPNLVYAKHSSSDKSNETSQEMEATFDDVSESEAEYHKASQLMTEVKDKFNIKLYLDFMYETALGDDEKDEIRDPDNSSFSTNHTYLLISANPSDKLRVGFDITFNEYYEIEYAITPNFFIKGGKIFLPFGDFRYHSIYGGKVYSIDNDLFPNWFTDYGVAVEHNVLDLDFMSLKYGAFISNGFREGAGNTVNMNTIGFSQDNNDDKAFGGRVKMSLFGGYTATASAMLDKWGHEGDKTLRLLAFDFATTRGIAKAPLLNRLNLKLGYLDNKVENDEADDYNAYGLHAELSMKLSKKLRLALRTGEVNPNEDVDDKMDQRNYNISGIYSLDKNTHLFAMYQRNEEIHVDEIDNDYFMMKVIVEF